jgi:two-component system NtrC family sensor kinase
VQASLHFLKSTPGAAGLPCGRRAGILSTVSPLRALFSTEIFMPRGHEYLWTPKLLLLEGASSLVLALGTAVVGASLLRRRAAKRTLSRRTSTALAAFALLAAVTYLGDVWLIWAPLYWLDALLRCLAAVAAVAAATTLVRDRGDR